ncbi:MAG: hypothetical protein CL931_02080 [Deltaproteobacteria bacterium]|nr:hypothetical protein [Deltaproteobacteria bacterium]
MAGVDYDFVRLSLLEWSAWGPDGRFFLKSRVRNGQEPTTWIPPPGFGIALTTPEETAGLTSVR